MRKALLVSGVWAVAMTAWLVGIATAGNTAVTADYARSASFDHAGWAIHCDPPNCPIPLVTPSSFRFDTLGSSYDAVVTASFTYRTSPELRIKAAPTLGKNGGTPVPLSSVGRPLPPAPRPKSVTLSWLVQGLEGGQTYELSLGQVFVGTPPTSYDVAFSNITLIVEGAPA
jgi:hypothetical protein